MVIHIVIERACKRCGHIWYPRKPEPPVQCPKCRSPYWDIPRGLTKIASQAVKSAPEGADRVDLYANRSHVGSVAVPQVPIVTTKKPLFGINVDDFLRAKGIGKHKEPETIEAEEAEVRYCAEDTCGKPMKEKFGKWFCIDAGCPIQGREQK